MTSLPCPPVLLFVASVHRRPKPACGTALMRTDRSQRSHCKSRRPRSLQFFAYSTKNYAGRPSASSLVIAQKSDRFTPWIAWLRMAYYPWQVTANKRVFHEIESNPAPKVPRHSGTPATPWQQAAMRAGAGALSRPLGASRLGRPSLRVPAGATPRLSRVVHRPARDAPALSGAVEVSQGGAQVLFRDQLGRGCQGPAGSPARQQRRLLPLQEHSQARPGRVATARRPPLVRGESLRASLASE